MNIHLCLNQLRRILRKNDPLFRLVADLYQEEIIHKPSAEKPVSIPTPNLNGGGHNGADFVTLRGFLYYLDDMTPRTLERIHSSSVMIPL